MPGDDPVPAEPTKPAKEKPVKNGKSKAPAQSGRKPPKKAPPKSTPRMEAKRKAKSAKKGRAKAAKPARAAKPTKAPKRKAAAKPVAKRAAKPASKERRPRGAQALRNLMPPVVKKVILSADHQAFKELQQVVRDSFLSAEKDFARQLKKQPAEVQARATELVAEEGLSPRSAGVFAILIASLERKMTESGEFEVVDEGDMVEVPPPRSNARPSEDLAEA